MSRKLFWLVIPVLLILLPLLYYLRKPKSTDRGEDWDSRIEFLDECISYEFEIDSLPYEERVDTKMLARRLKDTAYAKDDEGVAIWKYEGEFYYHPIYICHKAVLFLEAFRTQQDSTYLELARRSIDRLLKESVEFDGAIYYPYRFDHRVHKRDELLIKAPWYSGMAQGEILGLLVRMFQATGDSIYVDYADRTFKSFLRPRGEYEPWTVYFDWRGCYWVEEYPTETPSQTFNGFVYGMYGLYEYYLMRRSEEAERVLQNCLSTIKNYVPLYRRPGRPSFYALGLRHYSLGYHHVHIAQLRQLYKMTKDPFFENWVDTFSVDVEN